MSSFVRRLELKILRKMGKIPPRKKELLRIAKKAAFKKKRDTFSSAV